MKYWFYKSPDVLGPYDPADIRVVPGFSKASLVCSDEHSGAEPTHWVRASAVPEIWAPLSPPEDKPESTEFAWPPAPPAPPNLSPNEPAAQTVLIHNRISQAEYALRWLAEKTGHQDSQMGILRDELERAEKFMAALRMRLKTIGDELKAHSDLEARFDALADSSRKNADALQAHSEALSKAEPRLNSLSEGLASLQQRMEQAKLDLERADEGIRRAQRRGEQADAAAAQAAKSAAAAQRDADALQSRLTKMERAVSEIPAAAQARMSALRRHFLLGACLAGGLGAALVLAAQLYRRPAPAPKAAAVQAAPALQPPAPAQPKALPARRPAPRRAAPGATGSQGPRGSAVLPSRAAKPASAPQPQATPESPRAKLPGLETAASTVLSNVMMDGDFLVLTLSGPARLREDFEADPPRLMLDLIGVKSALDADFVMPSNPHIPKISAMPRPGDIPALRLIIQLQSAVSYEIAAQSPGLVVRFAFPSDEKAAPK